MTCWFVSRHAGALGWIQSKGIRVDRMIEHLDPTLVKEGDLVLGTLPFETAAEVCRRGARFCALCMDMTRAARGRELTVADMEALNARLVEFRVEQDPEGEGLPDHAF